MTAYDAIVIGAGVNGLTTAAYLARAGRRVLVAERRPAIGGLCVTEEFHPGYRANSCIDDPGWVPPVVMSDLGLAAAGYDESIALVSMSIPVDGAAPIVITPDIQATAESIRRHSARDAANWPPFCELIARLSGFMEALYGVRAPAIESNAPADLMTLMSLGRKLRGLGKRGMIDFIRTIPMPIADLLDEWFEHAGLKGALSTLGVLNVQHGPQSGGTALVFLHNHVGLPLGAVGGRRVALGGVGALPAALARVVTEAGGVVRVGADVRAIRVGDDRVIGIALASGEELDAPIVISSADPRRTFTTLVDAGDFDPEFLHAVDCVRMRGPQVRLHVAREAGRRSRGAASWDGALVVAPTMHYVERAYDAAKHGRIADDPWLRLVMPSREDSSFAPGGHDVLTVHAQYAAHDAGGAWTAERRGTYANRIIQILSQFAPVGELFVDGVDMITPSDTEARYGATEGSLLHGELTLDQFLFARPVASASRYAAPINGLWLCGSGTHPGAGTGGASGRLAAKEIIASTKAGRGRSSSR